MPLLATVKLSVPRSSLLLWAFLGLAACSAADKGPKYPDANSFCNARAQAECSSEVIKACAAPDATHCIANRQAACIAATPTGTSYNPNGAEPCISAVAAAYSDAKLTTEENRTTNDTCATVFEGSGSANATCQKDVDCKISTGLRCVVGGGVTTGTCQVPDVVQGGGSCALPSQLCTDGFHCGETHHCDINSQVAETCTAALPCVETARCAATGMCEEKLADGTACVSDDECLHGLCARGTGTAQGLCVSQMILAPNEPFCVDAR
jgi:hypothetical protein